MESLNGRIERVGGGRLAAGHRVVVTIADENGAPMSELNARVAEDGSFTVPIAGAMRDVGGVRVRLLAPDGEVLADERRSKSEADRPLRVEVARPRVPLTLQDSADPFGKQGRRLTGMVLDSSGRGVAGRQVTVAVRRARDMAPVVVLTATTDKTGGFSGNLGLEAAGSLEEATSLVSGRTAMRRKITLVDGRLSRHLLLEADAGEEQDDKAGCGCHTEVPRCPNHDDLARSPETYSEDLGGGRCVSLTIPNRTLEEFDYFAIVRSTQPGVIGMRFDEPVDPTEHMPPPSGPFNWREWVKIRAGRHLSVAGPEAVDHPLGWTYWDRSPIIYTSVTIAHGHVLHLKQRWIADGYSLGDLLYSLPLAPCQKKQVAIVDWRRAERASRSESLEQREELAASMARDRDVSEIVNSTLTELAAGGSATQIAGVAGGGALGGGLGGLASSVVYGVGGVIGGAGGMGGALSVSAQAAQRNVAAMSLQQVRDRTLQAASAVRSQRATVVTTVDQSETMRAETTVVTNHNHCHALTIEYFEVLRHFSVSHDLADVRECLFVPFPLAPFDEAKALRWRELILPRLRDRSLARGFDALQRMRDGADLPEGRQGDEQILNVWGDLRVVFDIARPTNSNQDNYDAAAWTLFNAYLGPVGDVMWSRLREVRDEERDRVFQDEMAGRLAAEFVKAWTCRFMGAHDMSDAKLEATLVSPYRPGVPLNVSLRPRGSLTPTRKRSTVGQFVLSVGKQPRTDAPGALPPFSRAIVQSATIGYRTRYLSHWLSRDANVNNDIADSEVVIDTPLDAVELANPRRVDAELALKLLLHLNEHLEYYHRAIWAGMDAHRRYLLLDGIEAPNAGGRSVAQVVENRLLGIAGNSLIFPIAPGYKLDPTYEEREGVSLKEHYTPAEPAPPLRVSVPTSGVFAEAVQGSCNACERKDESRFWRFQEAPCGDEPTLIDAVSMASRRAEPQDTTPTSMPAPIINMQSAPAIPDPTGLVAALALLGKPDLFRDMTGLELNQKNALGALSAAFDATKALTGQAAGLATAFGAQGAQAAGAASRDPARALETIRRAQDEGLITEPQATELGHEVLRRYVMPDQPRSEKKLTEDEAVKKLLEEAKKGKKVEVEAKRGDEIVTAAYTTEAPRKPFAITGSVGRGPNAKNDPTDVTRVRKRLTELGYRWLANVSSPIKDQDDDITIQTIRLFQAIVRGRSTVSDVDGRVDPGQDTEKWLAALNAPRWQEMPAGSQAEGFVNIDSDDHDWGTDWLADMIKIAGRLYQDEYRSRVGNAAQISTNDASKRRGGDTPDHAGHETGRMIDVRLPRLDGTAPGHRPVAHWSQLPGADEGALLAFLRENLQIAWADGANVSKTGNVITVKNGAAQLTITRNASGSRAELVAGGETYPWGTRYVFFGHGNGGDLLHHSSWQDRDYDRDAMRAMLQAFADAGAGVTLFNDPVLIAAGLCRAEDGHDDHAHVEIPVPGRMDDGRGWDDDEWA